MKNLAKCLGVTAILFSAFWTSFRSSAENWKEIKPPVSPTPIVSPVPKAAFDIHSKIGIVDVRDEERTSCLRTKNGDLAEKTPVSIIISLDEPPQKVLTATVSKKLKESCARYASESGDQNPGDNFFYSLDVIENTDEIGFEVGIGIIQPSKPVQIQNKLASFDLDEDGKPEFFRSCSGYEGTHFTIWTGKPLKGKRIWHSFYYVDYDTEPNCKKKDWKGLEN
jgi:hypothetical protein